MAEPALTASTITPVSAPMASLAPTANCPSQDVTKIPAKMVESAVIPMLVTTLVSVPLDGAVITARRLLIGAETLPVKTGLAAFKEVLRSNVSAKLVGPGSFAM